MGPYSLNVPRFGDIQAKRSVDQTPNNHMFLGKMYVPQPVNGCLHLQGEIGWK